jgi:hypothetical protein
MYGLLPPPLYREVFIMPNVDNSERRAKSSIIKGCPMKDTNIRLAGWVNWYGGVMV